MYQRGEILYENDFAKRLSELRIQKGVSARDMSLSLGQNSGYINHIENRQAYPSIPVFFNICDYFNISPEQFFSTTEKDPACISAIVKTAERRTAPLSRRDHSGSRKDQIIDGT